MSRHILGPIDFLKLDIEGAETEVLQELHQSGKMSLVHEGAIEFHLDPQIKSNSLPKVLELLESSGFEYRVSSSHWNRHQPWPKDQAILLHFRKRS